MTLSDTRKAVLLALLGYLCFSLADVTAKMLTEHYSIYHITVNNAVSALFLFALMKLWKGREQKLDFIRPRIHLARGFANFLIAVLLIHSFSIMPLADSYTMVFTAPFWAILMAMVVYKEKLTRNRVLALGLGFVGILITLRPATLLSTSFNMDLLYPLGAAAMIAFMFVSSRSMTKSSALSLGFIPLMMSGLFSIPLLMAHYSPVAIEHIPLFVANAILVGAALPCLSVAYSIGQTALISPLQYSQMVLGVILGFFIFGDIPSSYVLIGGGVIIAGGIYLALSERNRAQ